MLVNESQIRALIRLLADEDEKIVKTISGKLVDIGTTAVPLLQEAEIEQPEMAERIASVLEEIRGGRLEDELIQLSALPDEQMDLERGAFLIARYAYPSLDVPSYRRQLDEMAQEVRDRIGPRASGEETVKALNRYLFTEQGFKGNTKNYYEVENSYIKKELWKVRNFHQGFAHGQFRGFINTAFQQITGGRGLIDPMRAHAGHEAYKKIDGAAAEPRFAGDGKLTFDRLTDVYHSGTRHEEDQPCHLHVADLNICATKCVEEYGNPCQ